MDTTTPVKAEKSFDEHFVQRFLEINGVLSWDVDEFTDHLLKRFLRPAIEERGLDEDAFSEAAEEVVDKAFHAVVCLLSHTIARVRAQIDCGKFDDS